MHPKLPAGRNTAHVCESGIFFAAPRRHPKGVLNCKLSRKGSKPRLAK